LIRLPLVVSEPALQGGGCRCPLRKRSSPCVSEFWPSALCPADAQCHSESDCRAGMAKNPFGKNASRRRHRVSSPVQPPNRKHHLCMAKQILYLVLVTLVPALELRASIPYGILGNEKLGITPGMMSWPGVVLVCVIANIILGWAIFLGLGPVFRWLTRFTWFSRFLGPLLERTQRRLKPYVDRYGGLGVAVFIGIPLPGSGVYTGALGAFLLGVEKRKFWMANVLGVLIAAVIVTAVTLTLKAGMQLPWLDWIVKKAG